MAVRSASFAIVLFSMRRGLGGREPTLGALVDIRFAMMNNKSIGKPSTLFDLGANHLNLNLGMTRNLLE
ncbi:hypothetical protein L484_026841 [Morus notabilis]|uniref:Uncharacterized protein n=1 Tax=Morus notabilis TaxID=981085 RepID=W9R664_9ROSA|nr:hypothetical protein L484_026841 [Morus notabilis]